MAAKRRKERDGRDDGMVWCRIDGGTSRRPGLQILARLRDEPTADAKRFGDLRRRRRENVTDPFSTCGERLASGAVRCRTAVMTSPRSGDLRRGGTPAAAACAAGGAGRAAARARRSGDKGERSETPSVLILRDRKIPPEILVYKRNGAPLVRQRFFPSTPVSPCSPLHRALPIPFCGPLYPANKASISGLAQVDR
jgi:hypothetical protein